MSAEIESLLVQLTAHTTFFKQEELRQSLIDHINFLLVNDFSKLVQILYRVDVDEKKLKLLLQQHPQTDAAVLITDLLIKRQEEKKRTRDLFSRNQDISEEETW